MTQRNNRASRRNVRLQTAVTIAAAIIMIAVVIIIASDAFGTDDKVPGAVELRGVGVKSLTMDVVSMDGETVYPVVDCDSSAAEGQPGLACGQVGFVNPMVSGKYHIRVTIGLWEHGADKGLRVTRLLPVTIDIVNGQ